jgi:hypothetical protein
LRRGTFFGQDWDDIYVLCGSFAFTPAYRAATPSPSPLHSATRWDIAVLPCFAWLWAAGRFAPSILYPSAGVPARERRAGVTGDASRAGAAFAHFCGWRASLRRGAFLWAFSLPAFRCNLHHRLPPGVTGGLGLRGGGITRLFCGNGGRTRCLA